MIELSDAGQQAVTRLARALEGPDGKPRWPDAVLDDALAVLVLSSAPLDALDPIEEAILASFAAHIGVTDKPTGADLGQKIGLYFQKNPLPDALATEMSAALRELLTGANAEDAARALGAATDSKVPVHQRAPVAGSARMGVMGRFAFSGKDTAKP
jgi:hypothetical protein